MAGSSIRLRLTGWYATSILVLLLGGALVARGLIRGSLEAEFSRSQDTALSLVRGFFRVEVQEYRHVEATLVHISGELAMPDRRLRFLRPDGAAFVPPPGSRPLPLPTLDPPLRKITAPLDRELAPGWTIELEATAAPLAAQLRAVDRWALLALPVALLLAVTAGWVLTGRTLRPVAAMADAADRISATASGRIPVAVPDDELGRLGARFNALLDRLDGALTHQRRFLADAAHELRTPIARARGAGELALSTSGGGDDREALERTQQELETMSRLVDELMELARADAGQAVVDLQPGFLDDEVAEVVRAFEPFARRQGVALRLDVPQEVPAQLDPLSLRRLVGVLVDNAIRYSPAGGSVLVRVSADGLRPQLTVEDEGIGIPEAERPRLFERFFRGAAARQQAPDGSGLGLAIAQAIAQRHGAEIALRPRAPRGTVANVHFPPA
ncbi:MAG: HAMP domain-containing protein [Gemmatimonadaceae bacterium]|nr:HAMP domain-containing protein [Gemmatimonadaceae bacterium]